MANRTNFNKLPDILKTKANERFFDATVEQLLSKKGSAILSQVSGYIGAREPGYYDPVSEYFLDQVNKDRTWNQLNPIALCEDDTTGETSNHTFYSDLIDRIKYANGNVENHDVLFSDDYYCYAPPINMDMFVNYHAYYWEPDLPTIEIYDVDDLHVKSNILGSVNYSHVKADGNTIPFSDGLKVSFPDSESYSEPQLITEVATGIKFITNMIPVEVNQDYITIERGCIDNNTWSRTNHWYHRTTLNTIVKETKSDFFNSTKQAQRPIIEFEKNIELYRSGTTFKSDITALSEEVYLRHINNRPYPPQPIIDDVNLVNGDLIVLASDTDDVTYYGDHDTFRANISPYTFTALNPVSHDVRDIFVVTKRFSGDITEPEIIYNPDWYTVDGTHNKVSFTVQTIGSNHADDVHYYTGNGSTYTYKIIPPSSLIIRTITVTVDSIVQHDVAIKYTATNITITLPTPPSIGASVVITLSDNIKGLLDGKHLAVDERDIVEIYKSDDVNSQYAFGTDTAAYQYLFDTGIQGATIDNIVAISIIDYKNGAYSRGDSYHYTPGLTNDAVINSITYNDNFIIIDIPGTIPAYSKVMLTTYKPSPVTIPVNKYIWQSIVSELDLDDLSTQQHQLFMPYKNINDVIATGDTVFVMNGTRNKHKSFYYDGNVWKAVLYEKRGINQAPLFNLYYTNLDDNGNPISLDDMYGSTFSGSRIFGYKLNDIETYVDKNLGFSLVYDGISNSGSNAGNIIFSNDLELIRYRHIVDDELIEIPGRYYYKKSIESKGSTTATYLHTWGHAKHKSKQRIIDTIQIDEGEDTFVLSGVPTKNDDHDLYNISVNFNGRYLQQGKMTDLNYSGDFYVVEEFDEPTDQIVLTLPESSLVKDTLVETRLHSNSPLSDEATGYYSMPIQLTNNGQNEPVTEYTYHKFIEHFASIIRNQVGFLGDSLSSKNNYRDTIKDNTVGEFILQNDSPLLKSLFAISDPDVDVIEAINFSSTEYARYKDIIVRSAKHMMLSAYQPPLIDEVTQTEDKFDELIRSAVTSINYSDAFKYSHMIDWGTSYVSETFISATSAYNTGKLIKSNGILDLGFDIDLAKSQNGILLFARDPQYSHDSVSLIIDRDYVIISKNKIGLRGYYLTHIPNEVIVRYYDVNSSPLVPSTPSKIGCAPVYEPKIVLDTSYVVPTYVIVGHDGSKTTLYSDPATVDIAMGSADDPSLKDILDLRDWALLEFERRIYSHIIDQFRLDYDLLFRVEDVKPGAFRSTGFSHKNYVDIIKSSFLLWAIRTETNYESNLTYDPDIWKTWNYRLANYEMPGNWRGIYRYYYDTIAPNTAPWEMLGFSIQPTWWEQEYGTNYTYTNKKLWDDLESGMIRQGNRKGIDTRFARPGLKNIIPVNATGVLIAPHVLGLVREPTANDKSADWLPGDCGPAEEAWYNSSEYRFMLMRLQFVLNPGKFGEMYWDPSDLIRAPINKDYIVSKSTLDKRHNSTLMIHGEVDVDGNYVYNHGYQRFISDRLGFMGMNITEKFGNKIRNLTSKLGHRYGGFTNKDTLKVFSDGTSLNSTNVALKLPSENIDILVYKGKPLREYVYSGLTITITEDNRYEVSGYDVVNPVFKIHPRKKNSKTQSSLIGAKPEPFRVFTSDTLYRRGEYVRYNTLFYRSLNDQTLTKFTDGTWAAIAKLPSTGGITVVHTMEYDESIIEDVNYGHTFGTVQEAYDFIIGYGDYLTEQGWTFDYVDPDTSILKNWVNSANDFAFWASNNWEPGNILYLSASSTSLKLTVSEGYPDNVDDIKRGVYSILDQYGYVILPKNIDVERRNQDIYVRNAHGGNAYTGIYCLRINTSETEHIMVFDNVTDFNDLIYDPILGSSQRRLKIEGYRSANWYGKYESDGSIIYHDKLIPNYENLVNSTQYYYDSEVPIDNPEIRDAARYLIGYQNRDYLNELRLYDESQYQFYKGMISEKGTIHPMNNLLRSKYMRGGGTTNIYGDWAFHLGDFGSNNSEIKLDFYIDPNKILFDPQVIHLSYKDRPVNTKYVKEIIITNAVTVYETPPSIYISHAQTSFPEKNAKAKAILDDNGYLIQIEVTDPGKGYSSAPSIEIYDTDNILTSDTALAITRFANKDYQGNSDVIDISIDDIDTWLTRPRLHRNEFLVPTIAFGDIESPYPDAGYVNLNDINFTSFKIDGIKSLWYTDHTAPVGNEYIWVADASLVGKSWMVYRTHPTTIDSLDRNGLDIIVGDGKVYEYEVDNNVIVKLIDNEGEVVWDITSSNESDHVTDMDPTTWVDVLIFVMVRYDSTIDYDVTEPKAWIDDYYGKWAMLQDGEVLRLEERLVNNDLFKNMYLYDKASGDTITMVPVYDPIKGIIPGVIDQNLTYKSDVDPVQYQSTNSSYFGEAQIGQVWWDLSNCRYLYYEQDTYEYRKNNWGFLFPGSAIEIYEWTRSQVPPEKYMGDGKPKNNTDYTVISEYNKTFNKFVPIYYFWVKDKQEFPSHLANRTMSTVAMSRLLTDPRILGYAWFSFIDDEHFMYNNVNQFISGKETILQVNYRITSGSPNKHSEWKIITENGESASAEIPDYIWNKMVDSVVGYDVLGRMVPDPRLSEYEKYGNSIRPAQSWFKNIQEARKVLVESTNVILKPINIRDDLLWESIDHPTNNFWKFIDWFETGYDATNTIPKLKVVSDRPADSIGAPPQPNISPELEAKLSDGDIIQVYEPNNSAYYLYTDGTMNTLVRREKCTMYLKPEIYQQKIVKALSDELRELLYIIKEYILVRYRRFDINKIIFAMVHYVATEQNKVDWFFKTTYITLTREGESLLYQPKKYRLDPIISYMKYLDEIKPYQTKIRDFISNITGYIESVFGTAWDMDQIYYKNSPDVDGKTEYHPPVYWPFNPTDIQRQYSTYSIYDSIQCGFIDKKYTIELSRKTLSGDGVTSKWILPDVDSATKIIIDGKTIDSVDYSTSEEITTRHLVLEFNTPPPKGTDNIQIVSKISFDHSPIEEMRLYDNSYRQSVDQVEYFVGDGESTLFKLDDTYGLSIADVMIYLDETLVSDDSWSLSYAGIRAYILFAVPPNNHVDIKIMYNIPNKFDLKLVNFDLEVGSDGKIRSGWGVPSWDVYGWNAPGFRVRSDAATNPKPFKVYSGAANRMLKQQPDLREYIYKFTQTGNLISYSDYTDKLRTQPVSLYEAEALLKFKTRYKEAYKCDYQGVYLDAQTFDYVMTFPYDQENWDDNAWDRPILMPTIDVAVPVDHTRTAIFTGDGSGTIAVIPYSVEVTSVKHNSAEMLPGTYEVTSDTNNTKIIFTTPPNNGDKIYIDYNHTSGDNFDSIETEPTLDGGHFALSNDDPGITDELVVYKTTDTVVINVGTNTKEIIESFIGNGLKSTFVFTKDGGQGVSLIEVTVNGVYSSNSTLIITPNGDYAIMFGTGEPSDAPVSGADIKVRYRIGSLRQVYVADDSRHYGTQEVNSFITGGTIRQINKSAGAGYGGVMYDAIYDNLNPNPDQGGRNYTSRYVLPIIYADRSNTSIIPKDVSDNLRVYTVDDSPTGVTKFNYQKINEDYTLYPTTGYRNRLTTLGYTVAEVDEIIATMIGQYKPYMREYYSSSELQATDTTYMKREYNANDSSISWVAPHLIKAIITPSSITSLKVGGAIWPTINEIKSESATSSKFKKLDDQYSYVDLAKNNHNEPYMDSVIISQQALVRNVEYAVFLRDPATVTWSLKVKTTLINPSIPINFTYQIGTYYTIRIPNIGMEYGLLNYNTANYPDYQFKIDDSVFVELTYDTEIYNSIYTKSIVVEFNNDHHMNVVTDATEDNDRIAQKVLFDYEMSAIKYRVHLNEMDERYYIRDSDTFSTLLSEPMKINQLSLKVDDFTKLPVASNEMPGVAWIGAERITYTAIVDGVLKGISRATMGTSIDAKYDGVGLTDTTYPKGTRISAGDNSQMVPNPNDIPWCNSNGGLAASFTEQAMFLKK